MKKYKGVRYYLFKRGNGDYVCRFFVAGERLAKTGISKREAKALCFSFIDDYILRVRSK